MTSTTVSAILVTLLASNASDLAKMTVSAAKKVRTLQLRSPVNAMRVRRLDIFQCRMPEIASSSVGITVALALRLRRTVMLVQMVRCQLTVTVDVRQGTRL